MQTRVPRARSADSGRWISLTRLSAVTCTAIALFSGCGSDHADRNDSEASQQAASDQQPYWVETGARTVFKNTPRDAERLSRDKKCDLPAGQRFPLTMPPILMSNGHYLVAMQSFQSGCGFSAGYIYQGHVKATSQPVIHEDASPSDLKLKVRKLTWLRRGTIDTEAQVLGEEKCTLNAGDSIPVQGPPIAFWNFYVVNLRERLPGCGFSLGLVPSADVVVVEPPPAPQPDQPNPPPVTPPQTDGPRRVRAMLDVIGYAEGTGRNYNIRFGGFRFVGYADHPRSVYCSNGLCSDAAGRYQFLSTTWDSARRALGLGSFAPENQDRAAIYLMRGRGVGDLAYVDTYDEFKYVLWLVRYEWASMPESPYGQPTHSYADLWKVYNSSLNGTLDGPQFAQTAQTAQTDLSSGMRAHFNSSDVLDRTRPLSSNAFWK